MDFTDTSFLLSLEGSDVNTPSAVAYAKTLTDPIVITRLIRLEFENALSLLVFRGETTRERALKTLTALEADEASGRVKLIRCDWPIVFDRTLRISRRRAEVEGHRLLDIMHVAAALERGASSFLSFDKRQRELAGAEGLVVGP
jgi:predicted nucleic acid-binding protein